MTSEFAARLVALRKERGINQKQAAAELGISQALLSHYEKGIRECGLAFLCRCAVFYGVSTDYLLSLADDPARQPIASADGSRFSDALVLRAASILSGGPPDGQGCDALYRSIAILLYKALLVKAQQGLLPPHLMEQELQFSSLRGSVWDGLLEELLQDLPLPAVLENGELQCLESLIAELRRYVAETYAGIQW